MYTHIHTYTGRALRHLPRPGRGRRGQISGRRRHPRGDRGDHVVYGYAILHIAYNILL